MKTKHEIWQELFCTTITRAEAIKYYKSKFWEVQDWDPCELAHLQFNQPRLVIPFEVWWKAVDATLGHPTLNLFPMVTQNRDDVEKAYNKYKARNKSLTRYNPLSKTMN